MLVFLLLTFVVAGGLISFSFRKRPPVLPADLDHRRSIQSTQCLACHGPGQRDARSPNHPLNDRCFDCHERP